MYFVVSWPNRRPPPEFRVFLSEGLFVHNMAQNVSRYEMHHDLLLAELWPRANVIQNCYLGPRPCRSFDAKIVVCPDVGSDHGASVASSRAFDRKFAYRVPQANRVANAVVAFCHGIMHDAGRVGRHWHFIQVFPAPHRADREEPRPIEP